MQTILVMDDDVPIGDLLEEALRQAGYGVLRAYSGTEALLALDTQRPDLILLDLMLPGLCGEALLPRVREIPVIVVSAKTDAAGKAALLLGGAADYVTKPFQLQELLARVALRLREAAAAGDGRLAYAGLVLEPASRRVTAQGKELRLTRTEYAILKLLLWNPGQVITKSNLLDRIAADTPDCTESSLKMHVSNLRRKLRAAGARAGVEAVWGIGFRLTEEAAEETARP